MINFKKFVINLKRRKDRLENLNIPFDFEIFEATDGKIHFHDEPPKSMGYLGCWDSHRRLLEKIKNDNLELAMIMEDDVVLCDDFLKKLEIIFFELPEDWDLVYLGGWNLGGIKKYSQNLNIAENILTTHCMIIRQKFVNTLLTAVNDRKFKVDVIYCGVLNKGRCFIANPILAWQRKGYSDIENITTDNLHLQ
jgi:GR25 family glycosyltransferase involved in LPS biosynthesis